MIIQKFVPAIIYSEQEKEDQNKRESEFYINSNTVLPHVAFSRVRIVKQVIIAVLLWLLPFVIFNCFFTDNLFWNTLSVFFTKAALVTFGGAYAVLPYVAQVSVEKFHWLTHLQMIDGLALGESTPGPLIMVLSFVGFMGAYNHYSHSIVFGITGLLATVWFTFLPCFLFIFIGAPIVERTQNNYKIKSVLSFVGAAVVGVILNLAIYLFRSVVFIGTVSFETINIFNLLWIIISAIALHYFKLNMILWIVLSAFAGLGYYMLFP
jgi:chromate transporter